MPPKTSAVIYTSTPNTDNEFLPNFSQDEHDKSQFLTPLNNSTPEFAYEDSVSESDTTNNAVFSPIESILNSNDSTFNLSPISVTPEIATVSEDATILKNGGIDKDQVKQYVKNS